MPFNRFALMLSCAALSTWIAAKADAPCVQLVREGGTDQINSIDEQLSRSVKWSHGAYFFMDAIGGNPPVFYSLDRDGTWTDTAQFHNPEPTRFYTFTYDRESNGNIVFSGETETAPRVVSPFLAWTSADGKTQRMIRTDHYFPYEVAVAPDDSIWTLGLEMVNLDDRDPAVNQGAHVLRHFDSAGSLISSAFPQSEFNRYQRYCLSTGLFVATQDRLGWYGPQGIGKATYTEFSLKSMRMKEYPGAPSSPRKHYLPVALSMTSSGAASVSIQDGSPGARTNYVLDRTSSSWVAVNVPPMGGFKFTPILIGSDGDNLVFKYGHEAGFFSVSTRAAD